MPVTARLSSRFYEKLGDEAANELVNWLNAVDSDLRNDVRDINERNREWFRSEFATMRAEMKADIAALRAEFRAEIAALRTEFKTDMAALRTEVKGEIAALRGEMHATFASHLRWTIVMWVTTLLAIAGLRFV